MHLVTDMIYAHYNQKTTFNEFYPYIYTSYFAKVKKLDESGYCPISIAVKSPDWFIGPSLKQLAPSWSILSEYKETGDTARYIQRFHEEILSKLDPEQISKVIWKIAHESTPLIFPKIPVLLCYESPEKFCHRHLVAEWLTNSGIKVKEFGFDEL